jgi:hypothetical protein
MTDTGGAGLRSLISEILPVLISLKWTFSHVDHFGTENTIFDKHLRDDDNLVLNVSERYIGASIEPTRIQRRQLAAQLLPFPQFDWRHKKLLWSLMSDDDLDDILHVVQYPSCVERYCFERPGFAVIRDTGAMKIDSTSVSFRGHFCDIWPRLLESLKVVEYQYIPLDRAMRLFTDVGRFRLFGLT